MATSAYLTGRKKYARPQAMLWSENSGTLAENGLYVPVGYEVNTGLSPSADQTTANQFIILSDDNRATIDFKPTRIEKRERMINGRMRSYHVADKLTISTSWTMLPSRSFAVNQNFNASTGKSIYTNDIDYSYTTDGGAGGAEVLDWYNSHKGSFWVYLAYDNYRTFGKDASAYGHLGQYNQVIEMFISDFSYNIEKRGGKYDFWNISVTLEEV
jgi:hypothetical protein